MKKTLKTIVLLLLVILTYNCSEDMTGVLNENQAPETRVALFPDSSISQQKSRLTVHWWGDDPDGLVAGYFYKWEGITESWEFSPDNEKTFSLPIGTVDTAFNFKVTAVDNAGNGEYDSQVTIYGEDVGPEPFVDENGDGIYNEGEKYYDLGMVDPTPAVQKYPIKNSAPEVVWNKATVLPEQSFPVMTLGWDATDLDGDESITSIQIALNDTTEFISLASNVNLITLRAKSFDTDLTEMEILVNGSEDKILQEKLQNLKLDDNNRIYLRALDISGSMSKTISLPEEGRDWFVKKPKGKLLIIDDFVNGQAATDFYNEQFDKIGGGQFKDKFDVFDLENEELAYPNLSFLETLKLFEHVLWYSDSKPNIEFAIMGTQKFLESGGKLAYSMTLIDSSSSYEYDLATLQSFLPIESIEHEKKVNFMFPGAFVLADENFDYPDLKTSSTVAYVRTFIPNSIAAQKVYNLSSTQINGTIGFMNNAKNLFFIGLPLHLCDGNQGNVQKLLEKLFIEEFGLTL